MQFREQGRKIQCIRSTYDPAKKRSVQTVAAAFGKYADKIPSAEVEALTAAEKIELNTWFEARKAAEAASSDAIWLRSGARDLQRLAGLIRAAEAVPDPEAIWAGLDAVAKSLKKAGHSKPKKAAKPIIAPGQQDLLAC